MALLFIYGTLLQGEPNHERLAGARPLGAVRTPPLFTLMHMGEFPALVPGGTDVVTGELWDVDPDHLARLDEFEDHPAFYVRETVRLEDGREVFAYVLPPERARGARRIPGGDWRTRSISAT